MKYCLLVSKATYIHNTVVMATGGNWDILLKDTSSAGGGIELLTPDLQSPNVAVFPYLKQGYK